MNQEIYYRPPAIRREARTLPAALYNLMRTVFHHSGQQAVFVPVRSLLFQAVIDQEEVIFLDAVASRSRIVLAWQSFRVKNRAGLDSPVPYEVAYHDPAVLSIMPHLQGEFGLSLNGVRQKQLSTTPLPGKVLAWTSPAATPAISTGETDES